MCLCEIWLYGGRYRQFFFAKHVMKSKDEITKMHFNLYANHCKDLKLAMMVGDASEVEGVAKKNGKKDLDKLTTAIYSTEKNVQSKG